MARKLYTDVTLETPLKATYKSEQVDTYANDTDTVTIGSTEFIKITDGNGHNVKSVTTGKVGQLLLEPTDMELYYFDGTAPMTMGIEVVDEEPTPTQYTLTINPTPADAEVTLFARGFTQVGNSITVDDGTFVTYDVSKTGYVSTSGTYTINGNNHTISVTLEEPEETLCYLTEPASRVGVPDYSMESMTTSYAEANLWNNDAISTGSTEPMFGLKATSENDESGEGHQVLISTSIMGVTEATDPTTGDAMYFTPLIVADENGDYHKVAYSSETASWGDVLYMRLTNYDGNPYNYSLYTSIDEVTFQEAQDDSNEPISVIVFTPVYP